MSTLTTPSIDKANRTSESSTDYNWRLHHTVFEKVFPPMNKLVLDLANVREEPIADLIPFLDSIGDNDAIHRIREQLDFVNPLVKAATEAGNTVKEVHDFIKRKYVYE